MTNLLSDYTPEFLNTKFKDDLMLLLDLTKDDMSIILSDLMKINEEINSEETIKLVEKVGKEISKSYSKEEILGVLRLINLFTYMLVKIEKIDSHEIVDSILSLEIIDISKKTITETYLSLIEQSITYDIKRIVLANSNNLFFPRLIDIKCAAAIKAITEDNKIKSYLPIASIYISVKEDAREKIYFQATERDVSGIIEKLQEIQKTLSILEEKSRSL